MILELEENANDCLHCGGRPTAGHNDYIGDTYIGDTYCFFCKCGISTEWFSAEELLQVWNNTAVATQIQAAMTAEEEPEGTP